MNKDITGHVSCYQCKGATPLVWFKKPKETGVVVDGSMRFCSEKCRQEHKVQDFKRFMTAPIYG